MQVQIAVARQIEHPFRDDAAIGDDQNRVGRNRLKLGTKLGVVLDLFRLRHGDICCVRRLFYRRRDQLHGAAAGAIRLRDNESDIVAGLQHSLERGNGEGRGAAKD